MFRAPAMLMPHESTVAHEQRFVMESEPPLISRQRTSSREDNIPSKVQSSQLPLTLISNQHMFEQILERAHSLIPHVRPETPQCVTHNHDEDYSDEESDEKSAANNNSTE